MPIRDAIQARLNLLSDVAFADFARQFDLFLTERIQRMLDEAPYDDEEVTAADIASIERGRADVAAGRTVPHSEVLKMVREWTIAAGEPVADIDKDIRYFERRERGEPFDREEVHDLINELDDDAVEEVFARLG